MTTILLNQQNKSEDRIQQEIVTWYTNKYCLEHHNPRCLILHIPNEGKPDLVRIGLYAGASDLLVIHFGITHFVEVKAKSGVQSAKQKKFQAHVESMGFDYYIVRSLEEFSPLFPPRIE